MRNEIGVVERLYIIQRLLATGLANLVVAPRLCNANTAWSESSHNILMDNGAFLIRFQVSNGSRLIKLIAHKQYGSTGQNYI
jgi:hypothetical protein